MSILGDSNFISIESYLANRDYNGEYDYYTLEQLQNLKIQRETENWDFIRSLSDIDILNDKNKEIIKYYQKEIILIQMLIINKVR